ncbi:MAG: hypothetical protein WD077_10430 [Bacteroidia bacterium]
MEQYAPFLFLIIYLIYTFWNAGKKYKQNRPGQQPPGQEQPQQPQQPRRQVRPQQPQPVSQDEFRQKPLADEREQQQKEYNPLEDLLGPRWQEEEESARQQAEGNARDMAELQRQGDIAREAARLRTEQEKKRAAQERKRLEEEKQERKREPLPEYHPASLMEDFDPVKAVIYTEIFKRPDY